MSREGSDRELNNLRAIVLATGSEVEESLMKVTKALLEFDENSARQLIIADKHINERHIEVVMRSLSLIARQQPMARDVRLIAALLEIAGELERIHDYIKGTAKTSLEIGPEVLLLPSIARDLPYMTGLTQDMLNRSMIAFGDYNAVLAQSIPASDDLVDKLFNQMYGEIVQYAFQDPSLIPHANQFEWVIHNMERSADRVINICEWVIYMVTRENSELDSEYESAPVT